jgi:two-component system, OmpR family, response regulator
LSGVALIIMDVMMPGIDGIETCAQLRRHGVKTPVLFLSALDAPTEKVRGLLGGGDDYVTKPFDIEELVARIRAIVRRSADSTGVRASSTIEFADLRIDQDAYIVTRHGSEINLTSTEYRLLVYLASNAGNVLSKLQILNEVWEYDFDGDASVVETYVYYLRKKIDTTEPKLIHTVRGAGYSLRLTDSDRGR